MTELRQPPTRARAAAPRSAAAAEGALPAGKVLVVMVVTLLLASLFNSRRFVEAVERMPFGWQRTALLAVARPVDDVARALHFDRPRRALDTALGRQPPRGTAGAFGALPRPGGSGAASGSPGAAATPSPTPDTGSPTMSAGRDVSAAGPLRLFVTGDSMIEFMAPRLIAAGGTAVRGGSEVKYGTGLVRDDVFDWPAYARTRLAEHDPEAVVMLVGGNDGQNIALRGGVILEAGSPEWATEYRRRAALLMQVLAEGGRRVYWVGMPPAKSERLTRIYQVLNSALAGAAAGVPGATYVDIWTDFAPQGRYTDFLPVGGRSVLVRARDGIHVNREGAALIARKLYALLDRDWRISS